MGGYGLPVFEKDGETSVIAGENSFIVIRIAQFSGSWYTVMCERVCAPVGP